MQPESGKRETPVNYWRLAVIVVMAIGCIAGLPDFVHGVADGYSGR
jgi:hypothetical protein